MRKITIFIGGFFLLFLVVVMLPFSGLAKGKIPLSLSVFKHSQKHFFSNAQDKNLIKGNWQRVDAAAELHILRLRENGLLEANYLDSKFVFVEKAGWTKSSDVLRLFVIYRVDDISGYSLALNYLAEKDLLVGAYVDGSNNQTYNVTFKRIK